MEPKIILCVENVSVCSQRYRSLVYCASGFHVQPVHHRYVKVCSKVLPFGSLAAMVAIHDRKGFNVFPDMLFFVFLMNSVATPVVFLNDRVHIVFIQGCRDSLLTDI